MSSIGSDYALLAERAGSEKAGESGAMMSFLGNLEHMLLKRMTFQEQPTMTVTPGKHVFWAKRPQKIIVLRIVWRFEIDA